MSLNPICITFIFLASFHETRSRSLHRKFKSLTVAPSHMRLDEMLRSADDFRYGSPPRLDLFEACMRAYHTHIYAALARLFVDASTLSPMAALHTIAWLQEYRERLAPAAASRSPRQGDRKG